MGGLISGKFLFLLIVALLVLGPEKLPEAARGAGRLLNEFRRVTGGLQEEVREAFQASDLAGPVQELRAARDGFREAATGLVTAPFASTIAPVAGPGTLEAGGETAGPMSAETSGAATESGWGTHPVGPAPALAGARRDWARVPGEMGLPPGDPSLN